MIGDFPECRTVAECHHSVKVLQRSWENIKLNYEDEELIIDSQVIAKGRENIYSHLQQNYA